MVNQTDTIENGSFNGNLTILNSGNADLGPGNLEVQGTVYTNTISANTTSGSITLTDPSLFTNSTASTSAITGALVVTGGIGITGNSYFAGVNTYTNTTVIPSANGSNTAGGSINIAGGLALTGSANYSNTIIFNASNNAEPNVLGGTRSIGSKIVLWPSNGPSGTSSDYSIGIGTASMWFQVDTSSIFNWYSGATLIGSMNSSAMTIYGANAISSTSSAPSGALNIAGSLALYNTSALSACIMLQGGQYGPPSITSRTIGTRIVLNPTSFPTSSCDYSIGITTSPGIGIWFGTNTLSDHFYFYNNTTITLDITNASTTFGSNNVVKVTNTTVIPSANGSNTAAGAFMCSGSIALTNNSTNYANTIMWNAGTNNAEPTALGAARSIGSKLVLWPTSGASNTDYAIGIGISSMWYQVDSGSTHNWYVAATKIGFWDSTSLNINNTTAIPSTSSIPSGALNLAGGIAFTGGSLNNSIMFNNSGLAPPTTVTNRSSGTRIILYPAFSNGISCDFAIGMTVSPFAGIWYGTNGLSDHHMFYNFTSLTLDITNASTTFGSNNVISVTNANTIPTNDIAFTGTEGALNVAGDIVLFNATKQTIGFAAGGLGAPSFTNRTLGTKIILKPTVNGTQTDSALGVDTTSVWISNGLVTGTIDFYLSNILEMSLSSSLLTLTNSTWLLLPKVTASASLTFTLNGGCGSITTTSLSTAANGIQNVTLANTSITTTSVILASLTYTGNSLPTVMITSQTSGNCTFRICNTGTVALSAVVKINFVIL